MHFLHLSALRDIMSSDDTMSDPRFDWTPSEGEDDSDRVDNRILDVD